MSESPPSSSPSPPQAQPAPTLSIQRPYARDGQLRPVQPPRTGSARSGQHPHGQRHRRPRPRKNPVVATWTQASFHFSIGLTLVAIALVWSITPLSWGYVLWTAFSQLGPPSRRPAPPGCSLVFTVLHYLTLVYTAAECLFSIYYRYLAFRAQKLREGPRHSRKFLRGLILRSLENGLYVEEELEDEERASADEDGDEKEAPAASKRRGTGRVTKVAGEEEWQEQVRDEEEATRGSGDEYAPSPRRSKPSAWARLKRRGKDPRGDGAVTPELRTTDLPVAGPAGGGDYLSARQLPTLTTGDPPSRAESVEVADEGYGGDLGRVTSRMSARTLDSAFAASPRSLTAPQLSDPSSVYPPTTSSSGGDDKDKDLHAHSSLLPVRLSPSDPRALEFRDLFRFWFDDVPFSSLHKLNVADWFAWALYSCPLEQLEKERKEWDQQGRPAMYCTDGVTLDTDGEEDDGDEEDEEEDSAPAEGGESQDDRARTRSRRRAPPSIEGDKLGLVQHCVALVEARAAHRFPPGRNPKVRATRLTLDPVKVASRPLLLYAVVAALQNAVIGRAKMRGFREVREEGARYLVYTPEGWEPKRDPEEAERPLIFIHGLGMGACQYATLLSVLSTSPQLRRRPIVILLQPHISMSFFEPGYLDPPDQKRCTEGLERVLRRFGFDERAGGCTVLSHSNGTIVHGWLVKDCPALVARSCFVDPVTFCLWEPWVCHNFLVRKPKKPIEYLMRYFVSRELGVALMLSRTFQWTANLLFPSSIPAVSDAQKTAIFLSEEDSILNAPRMRVYLRRNGLREVRRGERVGEREDGGGLKVFEGLKHGESMVGEGAAFDEILRWVTWDAKDPTAYESCAEASSSPSSEE
ncbi:hypothetical protein JCM8097_002136 [Rhodosporidiobolus ruineniae]